MAEKLTVDMVSTIEANILDELEYFAHENKDAEKVLNYIAGIHDMANAVRKTIREQQGG